MEHFGQARRRDILSRIHKTLITLREKGFNFDDKQLMENLLCEVMAEYACSRRTAREYLDAVLVMMRTGQLTDKGEVLVL